MSQLVKNQEIWYHGFRLSPKVRQFAESNQKAQLPNNTLGSASETFQPGLHGFGFSAGALWEGGDENIDDHDDNIDAQLHAAEALERFVLSVTFTDGAVGSKLRGVEAMQGQYQRTGDHGQLKEINLEAAARNLPVRGTILHNSQVAVNTDGTALELGALTASQKLYGWLHVFSGAGDLTVKIQSDDGEAFSDPTDRIEFSVVAGATVRTSLWATPVDGAITDDWWRMTATVPGTRDFAVAMAIR